MAIRIVRTGDDPVLRVNCKGVAHVNDHIRALLEDMVFTMRHYDGLGLAAPQIGVRRRLIVVECEDELYKLVNPEIAGGSGEATDIEGCLSLPDLYGEVTRQEQVTVRGLNEHGEEVEIEAAGLLARAFQHEVDHLNGILFIDRAKRVVRRSELEQGEDREGE